MDFHLVQFDFTMSLAETGTHTELITRKGVYYNLVKNQLELGS